MSKTNLLGLDRQQLAAFFTEMGEPPFRATQVLKWIYQHYLTDFDQMTDLSKSLRAKLAETCEIKLPEIAHDSIATDDTRKFLLRVDNCNHIETVFIPEAKRGTLCISSQIGCALNCSFCATGAQGFNRDLTASEIIAQLFLVAKIIRDDANYPHKNITNVVLMGMGEPLLNLSQLLPALNLMLDDFAFGLSKRRVTVSTSGVVPGIDALTKAIDVSLALSLHAPSDDLRNILVPLNKKYPLAQVMAACQRYLDAGDRQKHVTMEYVMLRGVNDRPEDLQHLIKLLQGMPVKINLIPFNPFPGTIYECSTQEHINYFQQKLMQAGFICTTRKTRGQKIAAACGQLAGNFKDRTRRRERIIRQRENRSKSA